MRARAFLLSLFLLLLFPAEQVLGIELPGPKDYLEADTANFTGDGEWELSGNVTLHLESVYEESPLVVYAERMHYSEKNARVEVPGQLRLELPSFSLSISGMNLIFDGKQKKGSMNDIRGELLFPKELLKDETGLLDLQYVRFIKAKEPKLILRNGSLEFSEDASGQIFLTFRGAEILSSADEKADFLLKVKELNYSPKRSISLKNLRLTASGVTLLYLPRAKRRGRGGIGILGEGNVFPGRDPEDGYYILATNAIDRGKISLDAFNKYYFDRGLWTEAFLFTDPSKNSRLGVSFGRSRSKDIFRRSVGETKTYDFFYRCSNEDISPAFGTLDFGINYGNLKQDEPKIASNRAYAYISVTSRPVVLTDKIRAIMSSSVNYFDYNYLDLELLAFRHRLKLAGETSYGLDFVEFIHSDKFGSSPFRFEDNFPENQLSFQKNFALLPRFSGRVFGKYNYDLQHFDNLVLGVSKEFRSYYGGIYYDFARGSSGFEFALKF